MTVPDYQGLGSDQNYHPYLEPTTEGYNLIDAVRAARKLVPEASDRWVAVGISQGAQAAWAANELAATYGAGLNLLGSVSLAPPINVTFLADLAESGGLTKEQESPYPAMLAALKNEHPEFNLDDYRRGIVEQNWDLLLQCDVSSAAAREAVVAQITEDDLRPSSQAATDTLRGYLQKMSLPQKVAAAPMLVIYGGKDAFIPADVDRTARSPRRAVWAMSSTFSSSPIRATTILTCRWRCRGLATGSLARRSRTAALRPHRPLRRRCPRTVHDDMATQLDGAAATGLSRSTATL